MAAGLTEAEATPRTRPVTQRLRALPWWAKVLAVFAISRAVTTALLLYYASIQQANNWTEASPSYWAFAKIWDGHWYYIISVVGYPTVLPTNPDGHVSENQWAFMPVYPFLVRALSEVTTLSFPVVAVGVTLVFSAGTALLLYRLMLRVGLGESAALFSVVLFCFSPLSPLLQVAYSESMQAFLLTLALLLLLDRRYWWMLPVVAVMALTRPTGLAFALAMLLHVVYRWWRRREQPFPRNEFVASSVVAVFSGVMGLSWLIIAWIATGSFSAYTDTELAWRAPYVGYGHLIPFTPWFQGAAYWLPDWLGYGLLVVLVAAFFAYLFTPWARRLGVDIRFWAASYVLYLLAVFFPQSSTFRLLMPLFPLLGALALPTSRWWRAGLIVASLAGQVAWTHFMWWVDGLDWSPP